MADNPCPQLSVQFSKLPLQILRITARRKIAKHLDSCNADQKSRGYIDFARLIGFSDSEVEVFSKESCPTEALLDKWDLRKPTVGQLFACLQTLGRDDVIKDCIRCVEKDAELYMSDIQSDTSAGNLIPTGKSKTTMKPSLNGSKETGQKKQIHDPEKTFPSDLDYPALDDYLVDETQTATLDDLRNPNGEQVRYDAFVSVNCDSKKDLIFVKEMANILENIFHMKLFIPGRDSIPGGAEHSISAYVIDVRCNKVIVILSKSFLKSSACDFQLKFAQCLHPSVRTKKIIPVLIEPHTPVPLILRFVTVCDFTQSEMAEWVLERLICALQTPVPKIKLGEEDSDDDYTTDTSLYEIKLKIDRDTFNEVFNGGSHKADEEHSNSKSAHGSHNSSSLDQSQNSSSLDPKEKPKENKKNFIGSIFNAISKRKEKKQEKQKKDEMYKEIAMRLVKRATEENLLNGKDPKTISENEKHGLSRSGVSKDASESQIVKKKYSKKKAPLTESDGYAMLHDLQEPMPFNLNLNDHSTDRGMGTLTSRQCSITDTQDVECQGKKQANVKNSEANLNTVAIGQTQFHNSSRQNPGGYSTHTTADTQGRREKIDHSARKGQFPISLIGPQKTYPSSLKRSEDIPLSQGADGITAQLDESHKESKAESYQIGKDHTFIAKNDNEETQLPPIQLTHNLAISRGAEEQNAHLGTSVNATGATLLQCVEKKASGNDSYNRDRAEPVFV